MKLENEELNELTKELWTEVLSHRIESSADIYIDFYTISGGYTLGDHGAYTLKNGEYLKKIDDEFTYDLYNEESLLLGMIE